MRVLVVEDSSRLRRSVSTALKRSGYAVDVAENGTDGLWLAESTEYDVLVLDIMLPGMDGLTLLRRLRELGRPVHVLLLTAKDAIEDRVHGLQSGADDYLIKPFALEELLARVQALCRRAYGTKESRVTVGDLVIDTASREVSRAGHAITLKPREYALLEYLALRQGQVVSRRDIEGHIYDELTDPASNVVDSAVSILRKRLNVPAGASPLIHTRHGVGYVLKTETE